MVAVVGSMPTNDVSDEQLAQIRADRDDCDHPDVSWRWGAVEFVDDGDRVVVPGKCTTCDAAMRRWYDRTETTTEGGW